MISRAQCRGEFYKVKAFAMKSDPFLLAALLFFCCVTGLRSQSVGIGTSTPDTSALLDIASTDKGILIPRMTTVQRNAVTSPAVGLMVYDTDLMGFWYYNGTAWQSMGGPDDKWKMYGNTGTNSTHFLGTADDQPMRFRLNNLKSGTWDGANRNYSIGVGALDSITTGKGNIAIGTKALFRNKNLSGLVAIGDSSLYTNTTGVQNTAMGSKALRNNTTGSRNTANGFQALSRNTGSGNTAVGNYSLRLNTSGNNLVAVGDSSLYSNTTGFQNTAVGSNALRNNTTGSRNTANGFQALSNNTGSGNTAIGNNALRLNTTGNRLVAVGDSSLYSNTLGFENTAVGINALRRNTIGEQNVANGAFALYANTTGELNMATGAFALYSNTTGSQNTASGAGAMYHNTTGEINMANGTGALYYNTTGNNNTANGNFALAYNETGSFNVANGNYTLYSNRTGERNLANGYEALFQNTTGSSNVACGFDALNDNTTGSFNVAIGNGALNRNTVGYQNAAFGYEADVATVNLVNATAIGAKAFVADSNCLVLGSIDGINGATESVNVGIGITAPQTRLHIVGGSDASYTATSGYLVTGDVATSNIIMDDNEIMARNNGASAPLYLQVSGGDLKIGSGTPSYKLEVGSSEAAKTGGGVWIATSDERLKKNIRAFEDGLDVVKQIRPVQFSYNGQAGIPDDTSTFGGIIAQELKPVAPYMIGEFTYTSPDGQKENYMDYDGTAMTYILINAVKEQQAIIDQLKAKHQNELDALKTELNIMNTKLDAVAQLVNTLQEN